MINASPNLTPLWKVCVVLIYTALILSVCAEEEITKPGQQKQVASRISIQHPDTHGNQITPSFLSWCSHVYTYFKSYFVSDEGEAEPPATTLRGFLEDEKRHTTDQRDMYSEKPICKTCGNFVSPTASKPSSVPEEDIKVFRIKMALESLEKQLGLPHDNLDKKEIQRLNEIKDESPLEIPKALQDQMDYESKVEENIEDDQYAWIKREIFTGKRNIEHCTNLRNVKCYTFQFNGTRTAHQKIASAQLWIPFRGVKKRSISVYKIENGSSSVHIENESLVLHLEVFVKQEWIQLNVTEAFRSWVIPGRQHEVNLAIQCEGCFLRGRLRSKSEQKWPKPFLSVELVHDHHKRIKRSGDPIVTYGRSNNNQICQLRHLYLSKDLLREANINSDHGLEIGYCSGMCDSTGMSYKHGVYKMMYSDRIVNDSDFQGVLQPCCAPLSLLDADLHTREPTDNETVYITRVRNVKVQSCACY